MTYIPTNHPKASLILVCFNIDNKRKKVFQKFFNEIKKQKLNFETIVVHLSSNVVDTAIPLSSKGVKYIMVKEEPENVGLWQKEALINIGVQNCQTDNILVFDSDVYCNDYDWFDKIVERINNHTILQCFGLCYSDTFDSDPIVQSQGKRKTGEYDLPVNQGLCIAVNRKILEKNNYFNPFFIYGGGDSLFLHEYTNEDVSWIKDYPKLCKVVRDDMLKYDFEYIDQDVIHISHREGKKDYDERHKVFNATKKSINQLVCVKKNLLTWKNDDDAIEIVSKLI